MEEKIVIKQQKIGSTLTVTKTESYGDTSSSEKNKKSNQYPTGEASMNENTALHIFLGIDCDPKTNNPYTMDSDIVKQAGLSLNTTVERVVRSFVDKIVSLGINVDEIKKEVCVELDTIGEKNRLERITVLASGSKTAFGYVEKIFSNQLRNKAIGIVLGTQYDLRSRQGQAAGVLLYEIANTVARHKDLIQWASKEGKEIEEIKQEALRKIYVTANNNRLKNITSRSSGSKKASGYVRKAFESVLKDIGARNVRTVFIEDISNKGTIVDGLVNQPVDPNQQALLKEKEKIFSNIETKIALFQKEYIRNWKNNLPLWKLDLSRQKNTQESKIQYILDYYDRHVLSLSTSDEKLPANVLRGSRRARERLIEVLKEKFTNYEMSPMFEVQMSEDGMSDHEQRAIEFKKAVIVYLAIKDMQKNGEKSQYVQSLYLHQTRECTDWATEVAIAESNLHLSGSRFLLYYQSKNK